jgi:hypothetical protein
MDIIEYHPMLRHDQSTAGATAQCCVGEIRRLREENARQGFFVRRPETLAAVHAPAHALRKSTMWRPWR